MKFKLKFHFFFFIFLVSIFFCLFVLIFLSCLPADLSCWFALFPVVFLSVYLLPYRWMANFPFSIFSSRSFEPYPSSHTPISFHLFPSLPPSVCLCCVFLVYPFICCRVKRRKRKRVRLKLASVPKSVGTPGGQIGGVVVFWWHTHTSHTHLSILTSKRHDYRTVKG